MPERAFASEAWTNDAWFQKLNRDQRYLFIYLWTNDHCNQAGLYSITTETIAFEAKIEEARLPELLKSLSPKVEWYPDLNLVWVKNFLKRQAKSTKFIIAAIKSLDTHRLPEEIRSAFEAYNEELLHGVAPSEHVSPTKRECVIIRDNFRCQYCGREITSATDYEVDHIIPVARGGKENYLNLVTACRACNQKKLDKTPQEAGLPMPSPTPFHGAQATYILRTNATVREKWLRLFPDRYKVLETMLINIGQRYSISTADTHARAVSVSGSRSVSSSVRVEGNDKGEKGEKPPASQTIPPSESEVEESLSAGDRGVISVWRSVKGFDMSPANALALVARLRIEFADLDLLAESKAWAARKLSEPLTPRSRPAGQLWNWMRLARKFAAERGAVRRPGRTPSEQELDEQEKRKGILREGEKP